MVDLFKNWSPAKRGTSLMILGGVVVLVTAASMPEELTPLSFLLNIPFGIGLVLLVRGRRLRQTT